MAGPETAAVPHLPESSARQEILDPGLDYQEELEGMPPASVALAFSDFLNLLTSSCCDVEQGPSDLALRSACWILGMQC